MFPRSHVRLSYDTAVATTSKSVASWASRIPVLPKRLAADAARLVTTCPFVVSTPHNFFNDDNHDHDSAGELRAEEATGLITLRVRSGRYTVVAEIQVPDGYPIEGCGVELRSHNFPEHIARRHLVQVMPRRCIFGCLL